MEAELPDLTTPDGLAVASDMLMARGWPPCVMTLAGLWSVCCSDVRHELACRYAEHLLPNWERDKPDDDRPRKAIEAKRAWLRGEIDSEALAEARQAALDASWSASAAAWASTADTPTRRELAIPPPHVLGAPRWPGDYEPTWYAAGYPSGDAVTAAIRAADEGVASQRPHASRWSFEHAEQLALTIAYMLEVGPE